MIYTQALKIAVFGSGSIGCYLGGQLASSGAQVTFIGRDRFKKHLDAKGLSLSHYQNADIHVPPQGFMFSTTPADIANADIVLVTVKSQDTALAAKDIAKHAPKNALIISFQNGVCNADVLRTHLPDQTVLGAMVPFNVTSIGPAQFHCGTEGDLMVEAHEDPRLKVMIEAFAKAGQTLTPNEDIKGVLWGKLIINLNNALNALYGGTLKSGLAQRDYRRTLVLMIKEALRVLDAAQIKRQAFGKSSPEKMIKIMVLPNWIFKIVMNHILKIDENARSSMLDDLDMGRVSEIDFLQGEIVALAGKINMPAPVNTIILSETKKAFTQGISPKMSGRELYALVTDQG